MLFQADLLLLAFVLALQKLHQGDLFGMETGKFFLLPPRFLLLQCLQKRSMQVGIEHIRVYIALTTDGGGIAQVLRGFFDGFRDMLLRLRLRLGFAQLLEHFRGDDRNCTYNTPPMKTSSFHNASKE
jgi:hypothetical protein